ncbi:unnamed protein product [Dovyalis caffra]|uniref:Protein kinase domain-containing protein n=1 Tax=Dovyalis caffra TaxID=77055 RepID=A0AAV1QUM8_9ROSI|nr:unnamed protein product [Dovyalis caffra]
MGDTLGYYIREFERKRLSEIANGFVRNFQFGKVYHGVYARNDDNTLYHLHKVLPADNVTRLKAEVEFYEFLDRNKSLRHPNVAALLGYCEYSGHLGDVYLLKAKAHNTVYNLLKEGKWSDKCDVFSFGVLLLSLISKRVDTKGDDAPDTPSVFEWAKRDDGIRIAKLAMQCVKNDPQKRPTMKQVVRYLGNLRAVQLYASNFASDQTLPVPSYNTKQTTARSVFRIEEWPVTVKVWELQCCYKVEPGHNEGRVRDEIVLLQHAKLVYHPNLVKLIGYCYEGEKLGVVYDLNPLDTVYNLVAKGLEEGDVFAYGVDLISKRICSEVDLITDDMPLVYKWARNLSPLARRHDRAKLQMDSCETSSLAKFIMGAPPDNVTRLKAEVEFYEFLDRNKSLCHPNVAALLGYCEYSGHLGDVYLLKAEAHNTVYNLLKEDSFSWPMRIKVALGFASVLEYTIFALLDSQCRCSSYNA